MAVVRLAIGETHEPSVQGEVLAVVLGEVRLVGSQCGVVQRHALHGGVIGPVLYFLEECKGIVENNESPFVHVAHKGSAGHLEEFE